MTSSPTGPRRQPCGASWAATLALLALLLPESVAAFSTEPKISLARSFSPASAAPGQQVTVTLTLTVGAIGSSPLRGLYLSEAVPGSLTASAATVTLAGSPVTAKGESTTAGAIYSNCKSVRWVLEEPAAFSANLPVPAGSTLKITYQITAPATAGDLVFPGASWVAMIPSLGEAGDHFGFEDSTATLPVVSNPKIQLSPTALTFAVQEGSANPPSQEVAVSNSGGGTLGAVATTITYGAGAGWLAVSGSGSGNSQTLTNSVKVAGLAPNTYGATIKVSEGSAGNSPQTYTVSFTITAKPSETQPTIALSPTSLQFAAEEGGAAPAPLTVTVSNVGAKTMAAVSTEITYLGGSGWLQVNPAGADNSQTVEAVVDPAGLSPDTYAATVALTSAGASNTPQNFTVSFTVTPRPVTPTGDAGGPAADGGLLPADGGVSAETGALTNALQVELRGGCAVGSALHGADTASLALLGVLAVLALARRRRRAR